MYQMVAVSLDCPFLMPLSVFSNYYLFYNFDTEIEFLNNVMITKSKVLLSQEWVTQQILGIVFGLLAPKDF